MVAINRKLQLKSPQLRTELLLALLMFTLPFGLQWLTNSVILIWCVNLLASAPLQNWSMALRNKLVWATVIFFLWHLLSLFWTNDLNSGLHFLETKMSFLLGPFFLFTALPMVSKKGVANCTRAYLIGNLAVFLAAIADSAFTAIREGSLYVLSPGGTYRRFAFTYEELSQPFMHPGYLASYFGVAVIIAFFWTFHHTGRQRKTYALAGLILFLAMILVQGRINLIAIIITLSGCAFMILFRGSNPKILWTLTIPLILLSGFLLLAPNDLRERYLQPPDFNYDISGQDFNSATYRLAEWTCAVEAIKERPLLGAGAGDKQEALFEAYRKNEFWQGLEKRYNAHNQYLETAITSGIIGLGLLIFVFVVWAHDAWRRKNHMFLALLAFLAICMVTESMLERAWGVLLFNIIFPLLLYSDFSRLPIQTKKQKEEKAEK